MKRMIVAMLLAMMTIGPATSLARPRGGEPAADETPHYVPPGPAKSVEVGNYYLKRKKYTAAFSRFQEAAKTNPQYAPAYLGLGKVYEKMGLRQKALDAYRKYLDLLPSDKDAMEAKDVHRAIERLERTVASDK